MERGAPSGPNVIALLTDFGEGSVYVGAVKGVIATIAPSATVIDITHAVEPQAIEEAGFLLARTCRFFPPGTTFVSVVDPGVGSSREILLLEAAGRRYLAPDNGLLNRVLAREELTGLRYVRNRAHFLPEVSATFHGRDIFAPVAARLACGAIRPEDVGPEAKRESLFPLGRREASDGGGTGSVVHVDRFGNLVTDIALPAEARLKSLMIHDCRGARFGRTYADGAHGEPFVYVGSFGTLEVAVRNRSAALALNVHRGSTVQAFFEEATSKR